MKLNIYNIAIIIFLTFIYSGCRFNEEELFKQNAAEALTLLNEIMYNSDVSTFKNNSNNERFKIVHISDIHLSKSTTDNQYDNPTNLKQAVAFANLNEAKINAFVASGDFINTNKDNDKQTAIKYLNAFVSTFFALNNYIPSFICTGNHDTNMVSDNSDYYLSKAELNSILFNSPNYTYQRLTGENYYYADVSEPNGNIIRFIALDNTDQNDFSYNTQQISCITQKQLNWLINTALKENMTDKHSVIIITHHPLQPYSNDQSTYMCSGIHLYKETLIPSIIDAFIEKKQITVSYKTLASPSNTISVDANFENSPGDFICYLGGHAHTPTYFDVSYNGGATQIMLLANTMAPDLQNNNYGYIAREEHKSSSNSFSIYAIDTEEKEIYITYFGAYKGASIKTISYR